MKSADNVDNYALETPADTVYLKNTHVLELSTELDRAVSVDECSCSLLELGASYFNFEVELILQIAMKSTVRK